MTGQEMSDEFDLLYDTASEEAPGLDAYEKSMFLSKGLYELTELRFDQYLNNASRGFHDDEINRDTLKGFIASAVVELQKTPTISSAKDAAEGVISAGKKIDPEYYTKYKIEPTTENSYFFQRPSDSLGVIHEDVILMPKVISDKVNNKLVANVTPIRYDHLDRLLKNPFMKPRRNLTFRLNHSNYDGTSMSEIICDAEYSAYQYRLKYVKRPYPIILVDLETFDTEEEILNLTIESEYLPYLEPTYADSIRAVAESLRQINYTILYDKLEVLHIAECVGVANGVYQVDLSDCDKAYDDNAVVKTATTTFNGSVKTATTTRTTCESDALLARNLKDKTAREERNALLNPEGMAPPSYDQRVTYNAEYNAKVAVNQSDYEIRINGGTDSEGTTFIGCIPTYNTAISNAETAYAETPGMDAAEEDRVQCKGVRQPDGKANGALGKLELSIKLCDVSGGNKAKLEAEITYPPLYELSLDEVKSYIVNHADGDPSISAKIDFYLRTSQATNIDKTLHHDIVQRGVELAILHYRENTLENNMAAKIKEI